MQKSKTDIRLLTRGFLLNIPLDQQPCCGTERPRLPTSCQICSKEEGYADVFCEGGGG